eukprot:gnl/Hemi2/26888_TR9051_c0_g1_i1.p1 gnl/Hemi2/26888_TR9051_c0_g1~~gnl/Hemi2/26888_TR9051_c0_g1_i1.p1  ORF type:complete len:231 (+),score=56.84 gnl/Hemi2/26888_TR9051_c0_g1_i1:245-937(+)
MTSTMSKQQYGEDPDVEIQPGVIHRNPAPSSGRTQSGYGSPPPRSTKGFGPVGSDPAYAPTAQPNYYSDPNMRTHMADKEWSTGLFECFSDWNICCCGTFCTPCLLAQTKHTFDKSDIFCNFFSILLLGSCGVPCLLTFGWRSLLRRYYGIEGSEVGDFCIHCFCLPCAACQEAREIDMHTPSGNPITSYEQDTHHGYGDSQRRVTQNSQFEDDILNTPIVHNTLPGVQK